MNVYCTLFDSQYLSRGLSLYESLKKHSKNDFLLYIFPFDDQAFEKLKSLNLDNVVLIRQSQFENAELLKLKTSRSRGEYCWTCTPVIIEYILQNFNPTSCTYLDSDIYFYSSPERFLDLGSHSVTITEHRYTKKYDKTLTSGKYCVQFMTFLNNLDSLKVLSWWKEKCLEACELNVEKGLCGDQKYLDDWLERFPGIVKNIDNIGVGAAPWNIQQYSLTNKNGVVYLSDSLSKDIPLCFYHFHAIQVFDGFRFVLSQYELSFKIYLYIYRQYIKKLRYVNSKYSLVFDKNNLTNGKLDCLMFIKLFLRSVFLKHGN